MSVQRLILGGTDGKQTLVVNSPLTLSSPAVSIVKDNGRKKREHFIEFVALSTGFEGFCAL